MEGACIYVLGIIGNLMRSLGGPEVLEDPSKMNNLYTFICTQDLLKLVILKRNEYSPKNHYKYKRFTTAIAKPPLS